jgi:hypothetical protein
MMLQSTLALIRRQINPQRVEIGGLSSLMNKEVIGETRLVIIALSMFNIPLKGEISDH